jgi:hypothetical protein
MKRQKEMMDFEFLILNGVEGFRGVVPDENIFPNMRHAI